MLINWIAVPGQHPWASWADSQTAQLSHLPEECHPRGFNAGSTWGRCEGPSTPGSSGIYLVCHGSEGLRNRRGVTRCGTQIFVSIGMRYFRILKLPLFYPPYSLSSLQGRPGEQRKILSQDVQGTGGRVASSLSSTPSASVPRNVREAPGLRRRARTSPKGGTPAFPLSALRLGPSSQGPWEPCGGKGSSFFNL